jgi:Ca2+-binding EF-hand superfamily protein
MARRILAASAVALLALPSLPLAFAGDGDGEGDGMEDLDFPALAGAVLEKFAGFDDNADEKLSAAEFPFEELFVILDANKDGVLTKDEIAKAVKAMDGGKAPTPPVKADKADKGDKKGPGMPGKPETPEGEAFLEWAKQRVAVDPRFNAESRRAQILAAFDRDPKDGKVQRKEYPSADADRQFREFDMDKDGTLDEKELLVLARDQVRDLAKARKHPTRYDFLNLFDLDDDRNVTRQEYAFLRGPASQFRSFDEDRDGVVTNDELYYLNAKDRNYRGKAGRPASEPKGETATLWDLYDKDKDGRVTLEEFGGGEAVFRRLDRNRDGYLTLADG